MPPTAKACRQVARQLDRAYRNAAMGGKDVGVRVREPETLIALLRRAARELERA